MIQEKDLRGFSSSTMNSAESLIVLPGQTIAVQQQDQVGISQDVSFLRGHGTHLEESDGQKVLSASVCGLVQRVNQLITVDSLLSVHSYTPHTGDLVVGRVTAVGATRWSIQLTTSQQAVLPLSSFTIEEQRVRTARDAREMRSLLQEGNVLFAEVHKVTESSIQLHTRSTNSKLRHGCCVTVPPSLVPRQKNHYWDDFINGQFTVVVGCNGIIWLQRKLLLSDAETESEHVPYTALERTNLARLSNAVDCLRQIQQPMTPDNLERVYRNLCSAKGISKNPSSVLAACAR